MSILPVTEIEGDFRVNLLSTSHGWCLLSPELGLGCVIDVDPLENSFCGDVISFLSDYFGDGSLTQDWQYPFFCVGDLAPSEENNVVAVWTCEASPRGGGVKMEGAHLYDVLKDDELLDYLYKAPLRARPRRYDPNFPRGCALVSKKGRATPFAIALSDEDHGFLTEVALMMCPGTHLVQDEQTNLDAIVAASFWVEANWDMDEWLDSIHSFFEDYGDTDEWCWATVLFGAYLAGYNTADDLRRAGARCGHYPDPYWLSSDAD